MYLNNHPAASLAIYDVTLASFFYKNSNRRDAGSSLLGRVKENSTGWSSTNVDDKNDKK